MEVVEDSVGLLGAHMNKDPNRAAVMLHSIEANIRNGICDSDSDDIDNSDKDSIGQPIC